MSGGREQHCIYSKGASKVEESVWEACNAGLSLKPCALRGRQVEDRQGRNVVMLVESIRDSMPVNAALVSRRMALEQVSSLLSGTTTPPIGSSQACFLRPGLEGKVAFGGVI